MPSFLRRPNSYYLITCSYNFANLLTTFAAAAGRSIIFILSS
jgi:hypothetical protein